MNDTVLLRNRTFDEFQPGASASLTRTVGQDDIALFAAVSGDVNPAHIDPAFAANERFGHVVVHGMWTAALVSAVLGTELPGPGTICLGQDLRFCRPVLWHRAGRRRHGCAAPGAGVAAGHGSRPGLSDGAAGGGFTGVARHRVGLR